MPITQLPTPVPSRADPANFAVRADAFLSALPTFVTEANTLATDVTNAEASTLAARNTAVSSASAAQTSASLAGSYAGAQPWVSGSYATGAAVYSPSNFRIYRRKSPGGSATTDPANDAGNWQLVNSVFSADNGDVGIGTTSPTVRLDVSSTGTYQAVFRGTSSVDAAGVRTVNSNGTAGVALLTYGSAYVGGSVGNVGQNGSVVIQTGNAPIYIGTDNGISQPTLIGTNGLERMRIDASGNVGVGALPSADAKLDVNAGNMRTQFRTFDISINAQDTTNPVARSIKFRNSTTTLDANSFNVGIYGTANAVEYGFLSFPVGAEGTNTGFDSSKVICLVRATGNVGIGTANGTVASKLEVSSDTPSVADFAGSIRVTNTSFTAGTYAGTLFKTGDTLNSFVTAVRKAGFGGTLVFATNRGANANDLVESMRLDDAGRVCINDNSNIFSNLTVRALGGESGTFSLSGSSGASYVLLGNRNGLGATGPSVIASSNRAIQFGVGDSHSNTAGGTFTEFGRFSSAGNFGVGINPTVRFEVATSTGGRLRVDTSNPAENIVTSSNFAGTVFSTSISDAAAHVFRTSGTERARIDSAGNVGVGINSPSNTLHVRGTARFDTNGAADSIACFTGGAGLSYFGTTTNTALGLLTNGGERMRIDATGNTSFTGRLVWVPPTSEPTLATNGQLTVTALSNTSVRISLRGTDGVQRGVTLTLS